MEIKLFKKTFDLILIQKGGKKYKSKYVFDNNEIVIYIDMQRAEFKQRCYYINVSYLIRQFHQDINFEKSEYLGDVVYRFNFYGGEKEYSDCFEVDSFNSELTLRQVFDYNVNYFIENIRTIVDLKKLIATTTNCYPFIKANVEDFLCGKPLEKSGFSLKKLFKF